MPDGNPITNIFAEAFKHTTGLTLDIWTIAGAGVALLFLMIGFTKVTEALGTISSNRNTNSDLLNARRYSDKSREASEQGDDVMSSFYRSKSRNAIRRAAGRD